MRETELRLQVPAERRGEVEAALGVARWHCTRLEAHYFDTAGGQLAAHGFSWRLRKEGRRWTQTLKGGGDHPLVRLEDEVDVAVEAGRDMPLPDVSRHARSRAGAALAAALGGSLADLSTLVLERFRTRVDRHSCLMEWGEAQVEVAFDHGSIAADARSLPLCELELELKAGSPAGLFRLARPWVAAHGLWLLSGSKAQRGELLASGKTHAPAVKADEPALQWSMTPRTLLQAIVSSCLAQILSNAGAIAAGSEEAEHVHQARVGLRRLRTALRELAEFGEVLDAERLAVLTTAFRRLGEVRDLETVGRAVEARLAAAGAPPGLQWPQPGADVHSAAAVVREPAFQGILLDLLDFTLGHERPGQDACQDTAACRKGLRRCLARLHRQVVRDGERFTEIGVERQHRVRKRLKRLRYLSEFVTSLYGPRAVERYVQALRPAQDALGVHNDDAVGLEAYRRAVAQQPQAWFAVGWLSAHQVESARDCRRALRKVAEAPRFWKKGR